MKILLIGHGRHGKDTVAEIMRDYHGWSFRSSSHWAAEHVIYPEAVRLQKLGQGHAPPWEVLYNERHNENHRYGGRVFWYNTMLKYNQKHGGAAIARGVLSEVDVYVGMRSRFEFDAAMDEGLFDLVLWVDRSDHEPPEGDTMDLTEEDAHLSIDNNGSMRQLWLKIDTVVQTSDFYGFLR